MALPDLWAPAMLVAAFAGGAFGASIGALPSFSLAGLAVVLGELAALTADATGATLPVDITATIGFGVVLGPHVAFGGGAAALAYAAKHRDLDTDTDYHDAKAITRGLGSDPTILAVGGAFGVVGYWLATLSTTVALPVDPVAFGVVGSALLHRAAFGYHIVGPHPPNWFTMPPHPTPSTGVQPWLPYQYQWPNVVALGAVVGVLAGYTAYLTASPFLAFGITVTALAFLSAGVPNVPVTHHMALPASTTVLALVNAPTTQLTPAIVTATLTPGTAVVVGAAFGVLGAVLGEVLQRLLYAHADTHLDPPAASIVATTTLIATLAMTGVLPSAVWIPTP